ncbi:MAG: hypothetical protein U0W40_18245 [Acidimicrobiia bacterium]
MSHARRAVAAVAVVICAGVIAFPSLFPSSARASSPTVGAAVGYLGTQQLAGTTPATGSGAWDSDPTFAFVTPEAVLAVAEAGQTGSSWSTADALAAVQAVKNGDGQDPLAFVDLMQAAAATPGAAGKFIVLVAGPLGRDTSALAALVGDPAPNGSFDADLFFNNTLYAGLSKQVTEGSIPASTVAYVASKQKSSNGGWSYDADTGTTTDADIDTTGLALQLLLAGGTPPTDPVVQRGLAFLASQQNADGTWSFFGDESAESTSRALLAVAAAGYDVNDRCWRDTVYPAGKGAPFGGGDAALTSLANPDGSIAGPNVFSASFATAQALQGLERTWLPLVRAPAQSCVVVSPVEVETPVAAPLALTPAFTG